MKKIFILALLLLTLCCHASAASSIQIDNVTSKEVNNYIVNFITASGQNYILDSATEYGLVFTATHVRENFLGIQVATQQSKLSRTATTSYFQSAKSQRFTTTAAVLMSNLSTILLQNARF